MTLMPDLVVSVLLEQRSLADTLEDLLPQTQCTKCGFPTCRAYAEAMALGDANYNQCPPGGAQGVVRIALLLGKPVIPINPDHGAERARPVAIIDESLCLGCTLCIQACPVDAIVGAAKLMHSVLPDLCTGCDLCVPPCPVDCIAMVEVTPGRTGWDAWTQQQADAARARSIAAWIIAFLRCCSARCAGVEAASVSTSFSLAAALAASLASFSPFSRFRRRRRKSWRARAASACCCVHASQPVRPGVTSTIAMQSTGQGGTHKSHPVHRSGNTVCISLAAPTIASTGQA